MSTSARYNNGIGQVNASADNTDRVRDNQFLQPAYAATIALVPTKSYTLVQTPALTGAVTFTVGVGTPATAPYVGDKLEFLLQSDGTTRVATFGTGFTSTGILTVTTGKYATALFMFNGINWQEVGRTVTV